MIDGKNNVHDPFDPVTMTDLEEAHGVDIMADSSGKVWVGVDGQCILRVKNCDVVSVDMPGKACDLTRLNKK